MAKINLRPLDDRVVVRPSDAEEVTAGGIVLPDAAQEKPQRGKIVAVGAGRGSDIEVDGEELKILRESDILAKVL